MLLASYGVCFGLMNEKIKLLNRLLYFIPFWEDRRGQNVFERMFSCAYCTGFHTGWIVWLLSREAPVGVLVFALASSAFCYTLDTVLRKLEG